MSNLNPKWTAYNDLHNEGGEGFNPHSKYIDEPGEPEWSILSSKADKMLRILNGMSSYDPEYDRKMAEYKVTQAAANAAMAEAF